MIGRKETRTPSLPSPILKNKNGGGKLDSVGATLHRMIDYLSGKNASQKTDHFWQRESCP